MENTEQKISQLRVYTSVSTIPYSTRIEGVSSESVKLRTNHPPELGEVVTFELIGKDYSRHYIGNGKVVHVNDDAPGVEGGFELSFDGEMPENIIRKILH